MSPRPTRKPHALVLSRNYPNPEFPTLGLWAERMVAAAAPIADCTVVAPVPWTPPLLPHADSQRYRRVPRHRHAASGPVHHPRVLIPPGHRFHAQDARLQFPAIRRAVLDIHQIRPIDLIHAHLIYPDGVMAARLGAELGVPVITTEHALWQPWLDQWPAIRRQVLEAARQISTITVVSAAMERSVREVLGTGARVERLPNLVDDTVFRLPHPDERRDPNQLLFVGAVRHVKGLDVLVRALPSLVAQRPALRLVVIGEAFYGQWRRDEADVRRLCQEVGVADRVDFVGRRSSAAVAEAMRTSALLVVPSRRESFSAVAIEALASGTPVVATRCGGPEEFLSEATGGLVPVEDPAALAEAIGRVLAAPERFDLTALRQTAIDSYGMASGTTRIGALYHPLLTGDAESNTR